MGLRHGASRIDDVPLLDRGAGLAYVAHYYYALDDLYPVAPTDLYYSNRFDKTVRQKAVFGELTFDLTDKWSVTGGARWFEFDRHEVESFEVPQGMPGFRSDIDEPLAGESTVSRKLGTDATRS